jgi:hypothetical protein
MSLTENEQKGYEAFLTRINNADDCFLERASYQTLYAFRLELIDIDTLIEVVSAVNARTRDLNEQDSLPPRTRLLLPTSTRQQTISQVSIKERG